MFDKKLSEDYIEAIKSVVDTNSITSDFLYILPNLYDSINDRIDDLARAKNTHDYRRYMSLEDWYVTYRKDIIATLNTRDECYVCEPVTISMDEFFNGDVVKIKEATETSISKALAAKEKEEQERDYAEYLKLKKRFEG